MATITDEFMQQMLSNSKNYSLVILKAGPNINMEGLKKIIWEHGRRNFSLRAEGKLSVVCPVTDEADLAGIGIFNLNKDEVEKIMDGDPAVKEGVLIYEIYNCISFPGDGLPK